MYSGYCMHPPQPTVRTSNTEVCSFTKDDDTATGSVGVLTYDLFNMSNRFSTERMAIMFSVPFDYNFYKNWLGVGIFELAREVDKHLYKHMYKGTDFTNFARIKAGGNGVAYKGKALDIHATMSDVGKAIVKVEVYDKMNS